MSQVLSPWGYLPDGWRLSTIKDEMVEVTDYVANGSFASLRENVTYKDTEDYAILIRTADYHNNFKGNFVYIDEHAYNFLSKSRLFGGEIIIANVGSVGEVFKCPFLNKKMSLAPNAIMVKLNGNNDFYYYWFKSRIGQHNILNLVSGSAQPKFNKTHFKAMEIPVPPKEVQDKIAAYLSTLDDKIAINRRICENLESQAQALFKHWFIDFAPFKDGIFIESEFGMIPDGFEIKRIKDLDLYITDYVSNGSFASLKENVTLYQKAEYALFIRNTDLKSGSFSVYVDKHSYDFLSKSALFGGEIIISNVGDVGSVFLCPDINMPMTLGNNVIMLKSNNKCLQLFLYIVFKWSYGKGLIKSITGGSAQPKFNKSDFKSLKLVIPSDNHLELFHSVVNELFCKIECLKKENLNLSTLRDALLPKLMSGQIKL